MLAKRNAEAERYKSAAVQYGRQNGDQKLTVGFQKGRRQVSAIHDEMGRPGNPHDPGTDPDFDPNVEPSEPEPTPEPSSPPPPDQPPEDPDVPPVIRPG